MRRARTPLPYCNGTYARGIFRTHIPSPTVQNSGFEVSAQDGLPEHWTTTWTNFGQGEAGRHESNGQDSFEGTADLRLHVSHSGGAVFILSDPITVSPDIDYFLQCRMRYNLSGSSDSVYFTVIQSDGSGKLWMNRKGSVAKIPGRGFQRHFSFIRRQTLP